MKYASMLLLLLITVTTFSQPAITAKGKVTDEKGQALFGVSVVVKGSNTGTSTDRAGAFQLTSTGDSITLVVSLIGFQAQEIKAGKSQKVFNIVLHQDKEALSEVIVSGYGMQSVELSRSLQGRSAGVAITGTSNRRKANLSPGVSGAMYGGRSRLSSTDIGGEGYSAFSENPFLKVADNPLSTFSIDVDAASYSNIRRMITDEQLPTAGAIRIEEMINYFSYQYPQPVAKDPVSINAEITACPWNAQHQLALIGLQGKQIATDNLPASNLVFLIDVSGSMMQDNKLPLVKSSLHLLTDNLRPQDKVSIVTYAGNAGLALPATSGESKLEIKRAIDRLEGGGSTAGGEGIQLAYKVAAEQMIKGGNNRIILCTDGDFNVGVSSEDALVRLIEGKRETGIFLTVLGYGMGNYQDARMQQLADKGNGNHAYIDGISEARKVLVKEFGGTLFTIAKDVKLQIEFNPALVKGYRLIGYENRMLAKEDFNNDKKDAGEMGSGHTVTALYEIIPAGENAPELDSVDQLRYQPVEKMKKKENTAFAGEMLNIKLRYKQPDGNSSQLIEKAVKNNKTAFEKASENLRFAAAVAAFGMRLRDSKYKGTLSYNEIADIARKAQGDDKEKYRSEFIQLVKEAGKLTRKEDLGNR